MVVTLLLIAFGVVAVAWIQQGRPPSETRIVWVGYVAHVAASFAQYAITAYWYAGAGDMFYYLRTGDAVANLLEYSPERFLPEVATLLSHGDAQLPIDLQGAAGPTATMVALSGLLMYLLAHSWLGACVLLSTLAYVSRIGLVRVFLQELPQDLHGPTRLAVLLVPSATFWGAAVAKETVVMVALGPLATMTRRLADPAALLTRAWLVPVASLAGGLIWLVKPYVLVAFVVAAAVWWFTRFLHRTGRRLSRAQLVLGAMLAVGAVLGVGQILPDYSIESIAERAADLQSIGERVQGGSSYNMGNAGARSPMAQAAFVPVALVYSLFRPFLFEVRNPLMLLNAVETTWITVVVLVSLRRGRLGALARTARESPIMAFSLVFVVLVGIGVGLATTNLGTLTRYRVPMMPFYAAFLAVWWHRAAENGARPPVPGRARLTRPPRRLWGAVASSQ